MRDFLKDYLELLAYLVYTVLLFLSYSKGRLLQYKLLFWYYLAAAALLLEAAILYTTNNNWNYNLLFLLTIITFSWYFRHLFLSQAKKKIVLVFLLVNVIAFIYYDLVRQNFFSYNNYIYAISFLTIVIFILMYYHQLLLNVKEENLLLDFDFWLIGGYLMYFLGSFFIVLYYNNIPETKRGDAWMFANVILFICSMVAFSGYLYISGSKKTTDVR